VGVLRSRWDECLKVYSGKSSADEVGVCLMQLLVAAYALTLGVGFVVGVGGEKTERRGFVGNRRRCGKSHEQQTPNVSNFTVFFNFTASSVARYLIRKSDFGIPRTMISERHAVIRGGRLEAMLGKSLRELDIS
jgi:hypothetical protein